MLPAELPDEFGNFAVDDGVSGSSWGMVQRRNGRGAHGHPRFGAGENEYFEATSTETVQLPGGTDATLSYMEPVGEPGACGPHWEGKFAKGGNVYLLTTTSTEIEKEAVRQFLSRMVAVE